MSEQSLPPDVTEAETVAPLSTKSVLSVGGILILAAISFFGYLQYQKSALWEIPSRASIADKPELAAAYDRASALQAKIRSGEVDVKLPRFYIDVAQDLKMIGDTTRDTQWLNASLRMFERGIDATDRRNTLLIGNAAQLAIAIGNLSLAENFLREAIAAAPGDASLYINLVDVLVKKGATPDEVMGVFAEGERRIVGGADLVLRRVMYYIAVGKLDAAVQDVEALHNAGVLKDNNYAAALADIASARSAKQK